MIDEGESEDDFDWEEVAVPLAPPQYDEQPEAEEENIISILPTSESAAPVPSGSSTPAPNIEITIRTKPKPKTDDAAKYVDSFPFVVVVNSSLQERGVRQRAAELYALRVARLNCHKAHTILLLGNARVRNRWINDPLLHVRPTLSPVHSLYNTENKEIV